MSKAPPKSWARCITAWEKSGLSKAAFCRKAGVPYRKFCNHYRLTVTPVPTENVFVPLVDTQLSGVLACDSNGNDFGKSSGIRLCIGGVWAEIDCKFCSKTLSALLCLLEER